jgi:hypothetical protein
MLHCSIIHDKHLLSSVVQKHVSLTTRNILIQIRDRNSYYNLLLQTTTITDKWCQHYGLDSVEHMKLQILLYQYTNMYNYNTSNYSVTIVP